MANRLWQRLTALERAQHAVACGTPWREMRPLFNALAMDPVGDELMTAIADRQMEGKSLAALLKKLGRFLKKWEGPHDRQR